MLVIAVVTIDRLPVGVVHDDGMYTVLAKALASGQGYRWINLPGAPAATHYPPGYPALLSLVWRMVPDVGRAVAAFKLLNALLLAAVAYATFIFATSRLGFSKVVAAVATLVGCAGIPMLVLSTIVMSETMFLALLIPSLLFAEGALGGDDASFADAVKVGLIGGVLMLVRTHGVAFLIATVLALLLRRGVRHAMVTAGVALMAVAPWQFFQAAHQNDVPAIIRGDYGTYTGWLLNGALGGQSMIVRTVAGTSRELFATFAALTTAGLPSVVLRWFAILATFTLLAFGAVALWKLARVTALFLAAYVGILLLWPFTPARFLWGVWPLVVLVFAAGIRSLASWKPSLSSARGLRVALAACAIVALTGHAVYTVRGYRGRFWSSIPRSAANVVLPTLAWVDSHTPVSAVISTNAEFLVYLYTGRRAVPATTFAATDYFAVPSAASRSTALRSILQAYRIDVVAIVANDSLERAARLMAAEATPTLVLRDSVPRGLLFNPTAR